MNATFLIGNGFDLNCGMKTSFTDVCNNYVNDVSHKTNVRYNESEVRAIEKFKKEIERDIPTWGDFELKAAEYALSIKNEKDFIVCIRNFKLFLRDYLIEENNAFLTEIRYSDRLKSELSSEIRRSMSSFYCFETENTKNKIAPQLGSQAHYNVISFNYTTLFDEFLFKACSNLTHIGGQHYDLPINMIHIHGKIDSDIVLGIDNVEQLASVPFKSSKSLKRAFIKPQFNEEYDQKRVNDAKQSIISSDIICIFGMSLGDSDYTWKQILKEWLIDSDQHELFYYDYSEATKTGLTFDEKLDLEDQAIIRFLKKLEIEPKSGVEGRIHIPIGNNIFNLKGIFEKAKQENSERAKINRKITKSETKQGDNNL